MHSQLYLELITISILAAVIKITLFEITALSASKQFFGGLCAGILCGYLAYTIRLSALPKLPDHWREISVLSSLGGKRAINIILYMINKSKNETNSPQSGN